MTQLFKSKWLINFFCRCSERQNWVILTKKLGRIMVPPVTQLLRSKWQFFLSVHWKKKLSYFDLKSWVTWVELRQKHLNWKKTLIVLVAQRVTGSLSSIIAKAVNKQNTSKLLLYKLYFKMILKSFDFQYDCYFDFQITTSKMILILILKSSIYDDFAYLWMYALLRKTFFGTVHTWLGL